MNDSKPDLCDYYILTDTDSKDQNHVSLSLYQLFVNWLPYLRANIRDAIFPIIIGIDNEKTFLKFQSILKAQNNSELIEAMETLDIIDVKVQSLLSYVSISIAALIFLIPVIGNKSLANFTILGKISFMEIVLLLLVFLSISMVLCLSCANIIGSHTVMLLQSKDKNKKCEEYNDLVIKVTLSRRTRYLIAHRISVATAFLLGILFIFSFYLQFNSAS